MNPRNNETAAHDETSIVHYVQFDHTIALLLLKILEMESHEATPAKLREEVGITLSWVETLLKRLQEDPREFLSTAHFSAGTEEKQGRDKKYPRGRRTSIVQINPDKIVTNPISAFILLELAKASEKSREVDRKKFEGGLRKKLDHLRRDDRSIEREIAVRINFLRKIKDIGWEDSVPDIIWVDWLRFHAQKTYLHLLAERITHAPE